jgi:hypothetical protein
MPIHDWTRVDAGIFHHFHQRWIAALTDVLNQRLLPGDYYALAEQQGAGFAPDILTLKAEGFSDPDGGESVAEPPSPATAGRNGGVVVAADPRVMVTAQTDLEFYRRKQNVLAVRHVSGDRLVAVVVGVSKGNQSGRKAFDDFLRKAAELLSHRVRLLIIDLQHPTTRDPQGIHGAVWDEVAGEPYARPADKPLTLAACESGSGVRAFVEPAGVGDVLTDMPLFLEPSRHVTVPLEQTYRTAFDSVPGHWRAVLERS